MEVIGLGARLPCDILVQTGLEFGEDGVGGAFEAKLLALLGERAEVRPAECSAIDRQDVPRVEVLGILCVEGRETLAIGKVILQGGWDIELLGNSCIVSDVCLPLGVVLVTHKYGCSYFGVGMLGEHRWVAKHFSQAEESGLVIGVDHFEEVPFRGLCLASTER